MNLKDAYTEYHKYLVTKNVSENTITSYFLDLEAFHIFCRAYLSTEEVNLTQITSHVIKAHLVDLVKQKLTSRSICRHISAMNTFFKYLITYKFIEDNPMKKIRAPRFQKKLPHFFNDKEINNLCNLPDEDTFVGIRDRAIFELFYSSGLRISELVNLRLGNIDFSANIITVIGKGDKKRSVPVNKTAVEKIRKYMKVRNNIKSDIVFLRKSNEPMTRGQLYHIIKKYLTHIHLGKGYSPHTLRHTFASHLLKEGANLYAIKEMLGHKSLTTTEVYTHINPKELRDEYLRGHPRAEKKLNS